MTPETALTKVRRILEKHHAGARAAILITLLVEAIGEVDDPQCQNEMIDHMINDLREDLGRQNAQRVWRGH